jgi:hypothetical protein
MIEQLLSPSDVLVPVPLAEGIESAVRRWHDGEEPDALAFLRDRPELLDDRSVVGDLAYEEFCFREDRGERLDVNKFCARFPAFRTYIKGILDAHRFAAENPSLLAGAPLADPDRMPAVG